MQTSIAQPIASLVQYLSDILGGFLFGFGGCGGEIVDRFFEEGGIVAAA